MTLDIIKKVIDSRYYQIDQSKLVEDRTWDQKNTFYMECKIKDSKGYRFAVYKFDVDDVFPFFSRKKGYKRMADYLLFTEKNKKLYAISVELKKSTSSGSPIQQLILTEQFSKFILERIKIIDKVSDDNVKYLRVAIKSGTKLKTKEYANKLNGLDYLPLYGYKEIRIDTIIRHYPMVVRTEHKR